MSAKYEMPKVYLGQIVLWRHGRQANEPAPAIVTRVGMNAVSVIIFPTESKVGITRDGVRYCTDPALATVQSDAGVWDYTDGDRAGEMMAVLAKPAK